jgi:hypothetical protein
MKTKQTKQIKQVIPLDGYLLKDEVATRLRKTPRTVERWAKQGILPHLKLGRGKRATVLFNWPDIQAALKRRFEVGGLAN